MSASGRAIRADAGGSHAITPAGREACSLAATRHGVYGLIEHGLLPRCSSCPEAIRSACPKNALEAAEPCRVLGAFRAQLLQDLQQELEDLGGHVRPAAWPLVVEYAKALTVLLRIDQVVAAEGLEISVVRDVAAKPQKPGEPYARKSLALGLHPLMDLRSTYTNLAMKLAGELGLSPAGRHKLGLNLGGAPKKAQTITDIAAGKAAEEGRE